MPNRSEPLIPEVVEYLYDQGKASSQNSALAALVDWLLFCLQTGF